MSAYSYKYATRYSTEQIVARAYREYTDAISESFSRLMVMTDSAINMTDENTVADDLIDQIISEYSKYGYSRNTFVPTNQGVVTLYVYLKTIIDNTKLDLQAIDDSSIDRGYDETFTLTDYDGRTMEYSINSLLTELNDTFHAIAVEQALAAAYETGKDVASRIQIVRDTIKEKFTDGYTDFSNTLNRAIKAVKTNVSLGNYLSDFSKISGLTACAENGTVFEESELAQYTGATPISGYVWHDASKIVGAVGNTLKAMGIAADKVISSIHSLGEKALQTVLYKGYRNFINPIDVEVLDTDKGNSTIDKFYYGYEKQVDATSPLYTETLKGPIHFDLAPCEVIIQKTDDAEVFNPFTDITTAFTQVGLKQGVTLDVSAGLLEGINDAYTSSYSTLLDAAKGICSDVTATEILSCLNDWYQDHIVYKVHVLVKIKPVDPIVFAGLERDYQGTGYKIKTLLPYFDRLVYFPDLVYKDIPKGWMDDPSEAKFLKALACGAICSILMLQCLYWESTGVDLETSNLGVSIGSGYDVNSLISDVKEELDTTNKDFFDVLTTMIIPMSRDWQTAYGEPDLDLTFDTTPWVTGIIENVLYYQQAHPFDYEFWPYSHTLINWFEPSFRLKTDADNAEAFQHFVDYSVVIVLTAVVAITSFVLLKKSATRAMINAMGQEWNVTELAQKGVLTDKAINDWKKAKRKANRLSFLCGNLTSSAIYSNVGSFETLNNYDDVYVDLSPVVNLITG